MGKEDDLLKRLMATFTIEANENLTAMSSQLVVLEQEPSSEARNAALEAIYRESHSLKGAARAVNLAPMERACLALESMFAVIKKGKLELLPEAFDTLYGIVDAMGTCVADTESFDEPGLNALLKKLQLFQEGDVSAQGQVPTEEPPPISEDSHDEPEIAASGAAKTIRISADRLDSLLLQTEEMLVAKLAIRRRVSLLNELVASLDVWRKKWEKAQPDIRQLCSGGCEGQKDAPRGDVTEVLRSAGKVQDICTWNQMFVGSIRDKLEEVTRAAEGDSKQLDRMVERLLKDMKQVLMLPFSSLLQTFPRMIRDIARNAGKEVDLVIEGSDTEIDKRILEGLKIPLIHLVRNCVDHGLETKDKRLSSGKPERGRLVVAVTRMTGNKVEIVVSDDGAGINLDKLRRVAVKAGFVDEEDLLEMSDDKVAGLIYRSGVSTSPIVTDVSGRGLGMAIVQEKVEGLGGHITLETVPGEGTLFRLVLPLTLTAFRGILIQVGGHSFIVPNSKVVRVLRVPRSEIQTVEDETTIVLDGNVLSLVSLGDMLGLPPTMKAGTGTDREIVTAMVLSASGKNIAFVVDSIKREQEVLIKSLGPQLVRVRNIAGAMVQSSGEVVVVLNVEDLMVSAAKTHVQARRVSATVEDQLQQSILVVEDSITTRTLLANILETAGYRVKTAVDGVDGLSVLESDEFDLVVSDVIMPRMNGFEMISAIRHDEKNADLPLVLVTALESNEDRERGVDVGADAYIVKSSFDQTNLLETIDLLI